ncbi:MAG: hypothetical protein V3U87_06685 [Methylococcaceae bacterium]
MDIAKCITDGQTYNASKFSLLPQNDLLIKRRNLICVRCENIAFFRIKSTSGQAACFGARPHASDCSFASAETLRDEYGGGDEDIINNPGKYIVIDLDFDAVDKNINIEQLNTNQATQGRGNHIGSGQRPDAKMHRQLSTLLRNLINSEQFRNSDQIIEVAGKTQNSVADFFIKFEDIDSDHDGKYHGYWGILSNAMVDNEDLWLNTGNRGTVSCLVESKDVDAFYERHGIKKEDLAGIYVLILGEKHTSQNDKQYIKLENINLIALQRN